MRETREWREPRQLPAVIPPRTVVEQIYRPGMPRRWRTRLGRRFRIGYYSRQDGLETIWLVDDDGAYCESTDRDYLLRYFRVVSLSKEADYFGVERRPLGRRRASVKAGTKRRPKGEASSRRGTARS